MASNQIIKPLTQQQSQSLKNLIYNFGEHVAVDLGMVDASLDDMIHIPTAEELANLEVQIVELLGGPLAELILEYQRFSITTGKCHQYP